MARGTGNEGKPRLQIVPCDLIVAKAYVKRIHRHHKPPVTYKFALAVADADGVFHGVAIVGTPVARGLNDGWTLEVTRVCTDGTDNACSALYGACARTAKALGYRRILTYTLPAEGGGSLRGAGWIETGQTPGRSWHTASRPRAIEEHPLGVKTRWEKSLGSVPQSPPPKPPDIEEDTGPDVFEMFGDGDG